MKGCETQKQKGKEHPKHRIKQTQNPWYRRAVGTFEKEEGGTAEGKK